MATAKSATKITTISNTYQHNNHDAIMTSTEDDASYPYMTPATFAFGSCHKTKYANDLTSLPSSGQKRTIIWDAIGKTNPDTFLWTGDAVYPPSGTDSKLISLQSEYQKMLTSPTIGYSTFLKQTTSLTNGGGIHGTWDDHDFGGNDLGYETTHKTQKLQLYLQFLGLKEESIEYQKRIKRRGLYSSVSFGSGHQKVKVLFLDTRWHRSKHCIPSLGSKVRYIGAPFACVTRWITAGLSLERNWFAAEENDSRSCMEGKVLGEEQWEWLEEQLASSTANVHIVVSSIQVLTTNPVVESWGHFPRERQRLLRLLDGVKGLVLLSGDVHHGEILEARSTAVAPLETTEPNKEEEEISRGVLEVTSSGLTHSCQDPIYGFMCERLLDTYSSNRFRVYHTGIEHETEGKMMESEETKQAKKEGDKFYYTGRNFGTIKFDWGDITATSDGTINNHTVPTSSEREAVATMTVNVHDHEGNIVLTTGPQPILNREVDGTIHNVKTKMTWEDAEKVPECIDGHLLPLFQKGIICGVGVLVLLAMVHWRRKVSNVSPGQAKRKVL